MREIELKFKVDSMNPILSILEENHCVLSDVLDQHDVIYVPDLNHVESVDGSIWLRIRKENDRIELNYKKQGPVKMSSKEIEFGIDSFEKAKELLEEFGYQKWVEVHKKRRTTKYKNYNICLDEVEKLGSFVEIEVLVPDDDNKDYADELFQVAWEFGIPEDDRVNSHYDTMMWELEKQRVFLDKKICYNEYMIKRDSYEGF